MFMKINDFQRIINEQYPRRSNSKEMIEVLAEALQDFMPRVPPRNRQRENSL